MRHSLAIFTLFLSIVANAQSLTEKELKTIHARIEINIATSEALYPSEIRRPSEYIICMLEVDSMGKIATIHLFADEENKGKTYLILSKMTPELFAKYTFPNAKGKTISLPIVSMSPEDRPKYVNKLGPKDKWKPVTILNETGILISLSPMPYEIQPPIVDKITKWPKEIDSLRQKAAKNN